jgi:hypothetical protein
MNFSVTRVRPFRSLGLYRSSGKHAAPRGNVQWSSRPVPDGDSPGRSHAESVQRVNGPAHQKTPGPQAAGDGRPMA